MSQLCKTTTCPKAQTTCLNGQYSPHQTTYFTKLHMIESHRKHKYIPKTHCKNLSNSYLKVIHPCFFKNSEKIYHNIVIIFYFFYYFCNSQLNEKAL